MIDRVLGLDPINTHFKILAQGSGSYFIDQAVV